MALVVSTATDFTCYRFGTGREITRTEVVIHRAVALVVSAAAEFTEDGTVTVVAKPLRDARGALAANGVADAHFGGARAKRSQREIAEIPRKKDYAGASARGGPVFTNITSSMRNQCLVFASKCNFSAPVFGFRSSWSKSTVSACKAN